MYLHGGGYCIGGIENYRGCLLEFSKATGLRYLAVEYSLAPEYAYPCALNECLEVTPPPTTTTTTTTTNTNNLILGIRMADLTGGSQTGYLRAHYCRRLCGCRSSYCPPIKNQRKGASHASLW